MDDLERVVDAVVGGAVDDAPDAEVRAAFLALRRQLDRLDAFAARLLVAIHRRGVPSGDGASSTPAWVQWQTGQRWIDAKSALDAGLACEALPAMGTAWAQGKISSGAARTIARGRREGHDDVYASMEDTLVECATTRDFRMLDGVIRHFHVCADALDGREPSDLNGVRLSRVVSRWALSGDLDDLAGSTVDAALTAALDPVRDGDTRSPAKRRADALVAISRAYLERGDAPIEGGERPQVSITIAWESIRDGLPCPLASEEVALSPTEVSRLLCDARVARILIGPEGVPLDVGRSVRTVPRWMRRAVAARDHGCRFPGCDRRPSRCEAHHVRAWERGGPTAIANLVLLCPFHHHLVHRRGWTNTFDGVTFTVTDHRGRLVGSTCSGAPPPLSAAA